MSVFDLAAKISLDTDEYERSLKGAGTSLSNFGSKIGGGLKKIGSATVTVVKGIATGVAASSAAIGTLATAATKSYADYEQLVGGVETLFKDSANTVIANSQKAYKTAGMSANDYMETVTGFSASLLQSLGDDTVAAAEKADMAIIDMSDNANKMGTSIESIQTAYQGFAKQNYTMLDNLKLGYGGTKEEMERLLEDATKLSGVKYDISSYADIVDAIHVVQTEMGITGTTAKEASSTISGSISAAKASWQNLLTGLADDTQDLDVLVNNFFESIVTVGDNIIPRIGIVLNGITGLIQKLAPKIISAIPGIMEQILPSVIQGATALLNAFVGILPELATMILDILPDLISALETVFEGIVDALPKLVEVIAQALPTLIPQLITAWIDMVVYLMEHFSEIIQPIIEALPDIIISIVDALIDNLPSLIDGLISLVLGIVEAIPDIITGLIDALPTIIEKVITGLIECIPQLIEGVIQLIIGLVEALPDIITAIIEALPDIISSIVDALIECLPQLIEGSITLTIELVKHLPEIIMGLIEAIPKIIEAIVNALIEAGPALSEGFAKIFGGAWEAIQNVFSAVGEWFGEIFSDAWEAIKSAWSAVGDFFSGIWDGIVGVFEGIGDWFSDIFQSAWDAITGIFSGIGDWFKGIFDGLVNIVKAPINWIIDGINVLIDGLNMLSFDIPDWVPFVGGQHFGFDIDHIAHLAKGGIVSSPTLAMIGEYVGAQTNPEVIAPLSELKEMLGVQKAPVVSININNPVVRSDDDIDGIIDKVREVISDDILRSGMAYAR